MLRLGAAVVPKYPYVLAVLAGVFLLFFAVVYAVYVPNVFGASRWERLIVFAAFLFAAYAVAGAFFGFVWPDKSWRWGVWVSTLPYIWSCFFRPFLMLVMLCAVVLPACVGSLAAARLRLRRSGASLAGRRQTFMLPTRGRRGRLS